jgi:predicted transcriptional regulator
MEEDSIFTEEEFNKCIDELMEMGFIETMTDENGEELVRLTEDGKIFCKYNFNKQTMN